MIYVIVCLVFRHKEPDAAAAKTTEADTSNEAPKGDAVNVDTNVWARPATEVQKKTGSTSELAPPPEDEFGDYFNDMFM